MTGRPGMPSRPAWTMPSTNIPAAVPTSRASPMRRATPSRRRATASPPAGCSASRRPRVRRRCPTPRWMRPLSMTATRSACSSRTSISPWTPMSLWIPARRSPTLTRCMPTPRSTSRTTCPHPLWPTTAASGRCWAWPAPALRCPTSTSRPTTTRSWPM